MAGHSKWKQIKHKKAATDAKRGALFGKMARAITAAVRAAGGSSDSPSVQAVVERARAADMPKENIQRAVEKGVGGGGAQTETLLFEMYGPGGVACIIVTTTDSRNRTVQEIKHLLSEYECVIGPSGSALWAFEKNNEGGYSARSTLTTSGDDAEMLEALLEDLYSHEDVDALYTNHVKSI